MKPVSGVLNFLRGTPNWRLYAGVVVMAVLSIAVLAVPATIQHQKASAQAPVPATREVPATSALSRLKPDTLLNLAPNPNAGSLAVALEKATGESVLVVLPQSDKLQAGIKAISNNGLINWKDLQATLRQNGAMTAVLKDSGTLAIVQGRSYRLEGKSPPNCYSRSLWKKFLDGYRKLSSEEQKALVSQEGILMPVDEKMSEGVRKMRTLLQFPITSKENPTRLRLRLVPVIDTLFPNPPPKLVAGWWEMNGLDVEEPLKFPDVLTLPSETSPKLYNVALKLDPGLVAPKRIIAEIERATSAQVKVNESIEWPVIGVAGNRVALSDLFQGLKIATLIEPRFLQEGNLLYLSSPSRIKAVTHPPAVTKNERPLYMELLNAASKAFEVDLGPLSQSILQVPTKALPEAWVTSLLSGVQPTEAFQQVGVSVGDAITGEEVEEAIKKWREAYADVSVISVPGIGLSAMLEENTSKHIWEIRTSSATNFAAQCW